jgi:hypothetical protein
LKVLSPYLFSHDNAKNGANISIARGFTDWNQLAGIMKLLSDVTTLSTFCSARNVRETPACSNAAQKKIPKNARITNY